MNDLSYGDCWMTLGQSQICRQTDHAARKYALMRATELLNTGMTCRMLQNSLKSTTFLSFDVDGAFSKENY